MLFISCMVGLSALSSIRMAKNSRLHFSSFLRLVLFISYHFFLLLVFLFSIWIFRHSSTLPLFLHVICWSGIIIRVHALRKREMKGFTYPPISFMCPTFPAILLLTRTLQVSVTQFSFHFFAVGKKMLFIVFGSYCCIICSF